MNESGEPMPRPFALNDHYGCIHLRVPPDQHGEPATRAAEEGLSPNRPLCSLTPRP